MDGKLFHKKSIGIVPFKDGKTELIYEHKGAVRSIDWTCENLVAGADDKRISVWN
jgi:hypothetical protein